MQIIPGLGKKTSSVLVYKSKIFYGSYLRPLREAIFIRSKAPTLVAPNILVWNI